jgi:hypothetical protein
MPSSWTWVCVAINDECWLWKGLRTGPGPGSTPSPTPTQVASLASEAITKLLGAPPTSTAPHLSQPTPADPSPPTRTPPDQVASLASEAITKLVGAHPAGFKVTVARGRTEGSADLDAVVTVIKLGGGMSKGKSAGVLTMPGGTPVERPGTRSMRSTLTSLPLITQPVQGSRCAGEQPRCRLYEGGCRLQGEGRGRPARAGAGLRGVVRGRVGQGFN